MVPLSKRKNSDVLLCPILQKSRKVNFCLYYLLRHLYLTAQMCCQSVVIDVFLQYNTWTEFVVITLSSQKQTVMWGS